ncbi:MAG: rRNA maturation RNase YbeY [Parachlamydiales bacterium]|nr:rRNA maturation RNase YbeY [Parachlamydiales bacterium]
MISVYNSQKDLPIRKDCAKVLVDAVLSFLNIPFEEIAIYFVTEKKICELHDEFFQDPSSTDCISFPLDEKHLGEIFVCPKVAIQYAEKRGIDPYRETALYVIHGILHLIGYDDLEKKAKEAMRKKEKSCMRHLDRLKIALK